MQLKACGTIDMDLCETANCPNNTTCIVEACGSCKAVCMQKIALRQGGHVATAPAVPIRVHAGVNATVSNSSGACADGSAPFKCLVNPCATMICAPPTVCQPSYCGGCNASCTLPALHTAAVGTDGANTHTSANGIAASEFEQPSGSSAPRHAAVKGRSQGRCKDGSTPVECLFDPCKPPGGFHFLSKCGPGFVCEATTCGGCNYVCQPVQQRPDSPEGPTAPSTCPDGSKPVECFADPCETKNCAEGELCVRDYCGGCNAACQKPATNSTSKPRA